MKAVKFLRCVLFTPDNDVIAHGEVSGRSTGGEENPPHKAARGGLG
jgi:hypothetical protein